MIPLQHLVNDPLELTNARQILIDRETDLTPTHTSRLIELNRRSIISPENMLPLSIILRIQSID